MMIDPWGIKKMVWSGEIRWSFEYCDFLIDSMVVFKPNQRNDADLRGLFNAGGEL